MPNRIVSIQVAATADRKLGQEESEFEVVGNNSQDKTHWSVYTRNEDGTADHVRDYPVFSRDTPVGLSAKTRALLLAAELSMEYSAFIEKIR